MNRDIKRLGELLEELRTDHAPIYYTAVVLSALGVLGLICLLDAILGAGK